MIIGIFHQGSGLGNQLHRYVMTRVIAKDKGVDFGMYQPENFKGSNFLKLDMGKPVSQELFAEYKSKGQFYIEPNKLNKQMIDVRDYDFKGVKSIPDDCIIDGEFQGEEYFEHRMDDIKEWLKTDLPEADNDVCVINFRGGEYVGVTDLFLKPDYWYDAILKMKEINPNMKFHIHTDDIISAKSYFGSFPCVSHIEYNWKAIRTSRYLILSNSSFAILPALMNENADKIIAPKYWARRNIKVQALAYNIYKKFEHI